MTFKHSYHKRLTHACSKLTHTKEFNTTIIAAIFVAAIISGLQTYKSLAEGRLGPVMQAVDEAILYMFTAECVVKILAMGPRPLL